MGLPRDSRIMVMAPLVVHRKGEHKDILEEARQAGYVRVRVNGEISDLSEDIALDRQKWHTIEVVVDRLVVNDDADVNRFTDSVEQAINLGSGVVQVSVVDGEELLFSERFACVHCGVSLGEIEPRTFSFNSPHGACATCTGLGYKLEIDPELIIPNKDLPLSGGAVMPWSRSGSSSPWYASLLESLAQAHGFSTKAKVRDLEQKHIDLVLYGNKGKVVEMRHRTQRGRLYSWDTTFEGVIPNLERRYRETGSDYIRQEIERYMAQRPCPACEGQRLKPQSLAVTVAGKNIIDMTSATISRSMEWVELAGRRQQGIAADRPGADHRPADTQGDTVTPEVPQGRGAGLPHPRPHGLDPERRRGAAHPAGYADRLRADGRPLRLRRAKRRAAPPSMTTCSSTPSSGCETWATPSSSWSMTRPSCARRTTSSTWARARASTAATSSPPAQSKRCRSTPCLSRGNTSAVGRVIPLPEERRPGNGGELVVKGARENNLKGVDLSIPMGMLVCITGVSGSGKSSLIYEVLYKRLAQMLYGARDKPGDCDGVYGLENIDKVVNIDQSPIGRTPRSNPATYTGAFTPIRELFASVPEARVRGYAPGRFSFNVKGGRCEACTGGGYIQIEMQFLPNVTMPCEVCHGQRYNREALEITLRGKNISEVLDMTVSEALDFFWNFPRVRSKLETLRDVGLGYIRLGQPATTLSGGEAQRVKLATELSRRATGKTLYILDEPTTGLSFQDCAALLGVLHRLVDAGNTVVLIEHHLDLIKNADWIVDLGPGAGDRGGNVIATGTPEDVAATEGSHTGYYLGSVLDRENGAKPKAKVKKPRAKAKAKSRAKAEVAAGA